MKTLTGLLLLALCGCSSLSRVRVPANELLFQTDYGKLAVKHPQDTKMENVEFSISTNGTVTGKIGSLATKNSPDVIDKTSAGQVAIIKQWGETGAQMFEAGAKAAGTLGGKSASTAAGK